MKEKQKSAVLEPEISRLNDIIVHQTVNDINSWYDAGETYLNQFQTYLNNISNACTQQIMDWNNRYPVIEEFVLLRQWIISSTTFHDKQRPYLLYDESCPALIDFIESLPSRYYDTIVPEVYSIENTDSLKTKWLKRIMAVIESFRKLHFHIIHVFKRKKSGAYYQSKRILNSKNYFKFSYIVPVAQAMIAEWNRFNQTISALLYQYQSIFEKITKSEKDETADIPNTVQKTVKNEDYLGILRNERKSALHRNNESLTSLFGHVSDQWHRAGTMLHPSRRFNESAYKRRKNKFKKYEQRYQSAWNTHRHGEIMDWKKDIDLSGIVWNTSFIVYNTCNEIAQLFSRHIAVRFLAIKDTLTKNIDRVQKGKFTSKKTLSSFITQIHNTLKQELTDSYIPQTIDIISGLGIYHHLDDCLKKVTDGLDQVEQKYIIFKIKDMENDIPQSQIEEMPLKEIIVNDPLKEFHNKIKDIKEQLQINLIRSTNDISSLADALNYNGETARDLIYTSESPTTEKIIEEVLKTLIDAFKRAGDRLSEIQESTESYISTCINDMIAGSLDFNREVDLLRKNDHLLKVKLDLTQARLRSTISRWRVKLYTLLQKTGRALRYFILLLTRFTRHWGSRIYTRFSKITRLKETHVKDIRVVQDYLKRTSEYIELQPVVYRRLFNFTPLTDEKLFVGREAECRKFEESFNRWLKGNTGLIATVGERGSGRTTFLRIMSQKLFQNISLKFVRPGKPILTTEALLAFLKSLFKKPKISTLDKLEENLLAADERIVVIVEDLHRMFLKTIDGFNSMQRFILFMMHTDNKIFWVVSCSYYAWNFLDRVIGIGALFGTVYFLNELSAEELEELLMRRHRLSGIRLNFTADKVLGRSKQFRKLTTETEREEWLKKRYMIQLEQISTGNISVAMLFWQRSIRVASDSRFEIETGDSLEVGNFHDLSTEDLFALTALIQHEALSIQDFAQVMNLSLDNARIRLISLHNRGIVIEKDEKYELHFFLYRSVIRLLYEKRFLH